MQVFFESKAPIDPPADRWGRFVWRTPVGTDHLGSAILGAQT